MTTAQLTDLQLDVVRVLWRRGEASVADVRDDLVERNLATTTVGTILTRLEKQGVVARRKRGRHYLYRPAITQRAVRRSMVERLVGSLFDGDPAALVHHLVHDSEIKNVDLEGLRAMLAASEGKDSE